MRIDNDRRIAFEKVLFDVEVATYNSPLKIYKSA